MILLDLFSCAGLAADGYAAAGFTVYCIDNDPKALRHNPHPSLCMDAMDALDILEDGGSLTFSDGTTLTANDLSAVHASPPCQGYSATRKLADAQGKGQGRAVDLLGPTMAELRWLGIPWVVENVERSPLRHVADRARLCGSSYGLKVQRHRLFVSEWFDLTSSVCRHEVFDADERTGKPRPWGVYYAMGDSIPSGGRTVATIEHGHSVMGVTERTVPWRFLCEGLPPAYTADLGRQMVAQLRERAA